MKTLTPSKPLTWKTLQELTTTPSWSAYTMCIEEVLQVGEAADFVAFDQTMIVRKIEPDRYRLWNRRRTLAEL